MKKVLKFVKLFVFISLLFVNLISCKNKVAEKYFNEALKIIDVNFFSLSNEEFNNAINYLDKSINEDKTMWKAYRQKNQLYKGRKNYKKIIEVFEQWITNGNTMDGAKQFSYSCAIYSSGNKDKAMSIFSEIYNKNKDKIKDGKFYKKEEMEFVVTVFSGIITNNIKDIFPIDNYIVPGYPNKTMDAYNELSQEEKLQDLFYNFLVLYEQSPEEIIISYAGA